MSKGYINDTVLCGERGFIVWDKTANNFGHCFQELCLLLPAQVCLAVVSAYYLGFQASQYYLRTATQKYILLTRSLVTLVLALLPLVQTISLYSLHHDSVTRHGEAELLSGAVACFSWSLHLMYTYLLYHRLSLSIRGPRMMMVTWVMCLLVNIIQVRFKFNNSLDLRLHIHC